MLASSVESRAGFVCNSTVAFLSKYIARLARVLESATCKEAFQLDVSTHALLNQGGTKQMNTAEYCREHVSKGTQQAKHDRSGAITLAGRSCICVINYKWLLSHEDHPF